MLPLGHDSQRTVVNLNLETTSGKRPHEQHRAAVLRDIDEAACARQLGSETADVDIATRVTFGQTQDGQVQASAIVKIELLVRVDHSRRIDGGTKIHGAAWDATNHAGFRREGDVGQQPLFIGHAGHAFGHANSEINHRIGHQLERGPPSDHLALVHSQRGKGIERPPHGAREGRVVGRPEGLHVQFGGRHNNAVHQHAGHLDLAWVHAASLRDELHLCNHQAPGVFDGHGDGQGVLRQCLALHGEIALGVGNRGPDERDMRLRDTVKQQLFAAQCYHFHQVLLGLGIDFCALLAWVDKSSQAHTRNIARQACRDVAVKVRDDAQRKVVGLHLPGDRHLRQARHHTPVPANGTTHQPIARQAVHAPVMCVTGATTKNERQSRRMCRFGMTLRQSLQQRIWNPYRTKPGAYENMVVVDKSHGIFGGNFFCLHEYSSQSVRIRTSLIS